MIAQRFRDDGRSLARFHYLTLVECPQCSRCSSIMPRDSGKVGLWDARRVSCLHCGYAHDWPSPLKRANKPRLQWQKEQRFGSHRRQISTAVIVPTSQSWLAHRGSGVRDGYFNLPLYLQVECVGHVLWAYNAEHLDWLESLVAASLRELSPRQPRSLAHALPKWMLLARNRDAVVQGIGRLRARLVG